jgi:Xaa-Pro aminopeptidase
VKDEDELALMIEAALAAASSLSTFWAFIRPGLREIEVAAELEHQARLLGAEGMSFETIVASGVRSSLAARESDDRRTAARGFLTLDFGIILGGYCSDMTRTVFLGKPEGQRAQHLRRGAGSAGGCGGRGEVGRKLREVDEAARSVLRREGLAEAFSHSTGHGVGLEIHEPPRIGAGQTTRLLPAWSSPSSLEFIWQAASAFASKIWWL